MARKAIGKKVRFEVFKRDSFKCQYCGASAPEAVLEVDHIDPVAKGGTNDIMNLITACQGCNAGKSDRVLSDQSVVQKQKAQLDELNARREQLEMMLVWRSGVANIKEQEFSTAITHWNDQTLGLVLYESGEKIVRALVRKYGLAKVLDSMDLAAEKYLERDADGEATQESYDLALKKVGGILAIGEMPEAEKRLHYIKGIVRNRMYMPHDIMDWLHNTVEAGVSIDALEHEAKHARNWTTFRDWMLDAQEGD